MKKLISIILSLVLVMGTLPMIASAETTLDAIVASQDCAVRGGTDAGKNLNKEKEDYNWGYATISATGDYSTAVYYSFKLPEIPEGKTVTKAMFKVNFRDTTNCADATKYLLKFYPVNDAWDQETIKWNDQPLATDGRYLAGDPDLTFDLVKGASNKAVEYDIAPLVRKYLSSGNTDIDFSFAIVSWASTGSTAANIYSLENEDASLHPTLTLTTDTFPGFSFESVSVEDGATIAPTDDVTFSFNNEVDPASVSASDFVVTDFAGNTVEIADDDFSVSGTDVTFSKDLAPYDAYTVSLSGVADIYGQNFAGSAAVSFATTGGDNLASSNLAVQKTLKMDMSSGSLSIQESGDTTGATKYSFPKSNAKQAGYIVFRFDLSGVDKTKYLADAQLSWWDDYDWKGTYHVYQIPAGTWTTKSEVTGDYYNAVDAATKDASNLVTSFAFNYGNKRGDYQNTVSVASQVEQALKNGETSIAFTVVHDASNSIYTHNVYHEANKDYKPVMSLSTANPSFDVIESTPAKGGVMDGIVEPVEMTLATALTDETATEDYIKLVKASNGAEVAAAVSYENGKLTVTPSDELEERTAYQIVFKAGIEDTFGNILEEDKIVNGFRTSTALEFFGIKFTYEEAPVYDDCEEIENYSATEDVTAVAKIKNGSSSDLDAVMIIAIYGEDDSLIAVDAFGGKNCAPANEETQYAKTITVPEDAEGTKIKAFIWDGLNNIRPIFDHVEINQAQ